MFLFEPISSRLVSQNIGARNKRFSIGFSPPPPQGLQAQLWHVQYTALCDVVLMEMLRDHRM
jgi:hypothetical protein